MQTFQLIFFTAFVLFLVVVYIAKWLNEKYETNNAKDTMIIQKNTSNTDNVSIQNISGDGKNIISINGRTFSGNSVNIINGEVIIDGKKQDSLSSFEEKIINITIQGSVESVSTSIGDITITESVKNNVKNTNGDINIGGNVGGSVTTTNGNIDCSNVSGDVKTTNGNIKYKK